jgi:hypothetical protein
MKLEKDDHSNKKDEDERIKYYFISSTFLSIAPIVIKYWATI